MVAAAVLRAWAGSVFCNGGGFFCRCVVFFFQAEDGIRDLVRSRGLGDVYKRQRLAVWTGRWRLAVGTGWLALGTGRAGSGGGARRGPVSYTHLTLPTSDLV